MRNACAGRPFPARHPMQLLLLCVTAPALASAGEPAGSHEERLGAVEVHADCGHAAMPHLERGLALLHHMTYEAAEQAFARAAKADPGCVMAWWGQAMSYIHPLWTDPPPAATFERGLAIVAKAASLEPSTPEERAYLAAVEAYYRAGRQPDETANLEAFAEGWERAHEQHPDDLEAASFHALALLATSDPADKTFSRQTRAADIVASIRARVPTHPGAHHYIIHALDYPPLADRALDVARQYGGIAPDVPHALHMPTHIFTRLGYWQESIDWNERSAAAALEQPVHDAVSKHYLHALDYLAYAHLQRGDDTNAEAVLERIHAIDQPMEPEIAVAYALAAVPARLLLERQQWARAAQLSPRTPEAFPWDQFPAMEAITWFARGVGAARSGNAAAARAALASLASLRAEVARTSGYWAGQIDIQRMAAEAWLAQAEGDDARALELMEEAAEREASTEKHPVTPGEVLPAAELLGDLLLELERPSEALAAYQGSLSRTPNRLNSLAGAARAAEHAGDEATALRYHRALLVLAGESGTHLAAVEHARGYVSSP